MEMAFRAPSDGAQRMKAAAQKRDENDQYGSLFIPFGFESIVRGGNVKKQLP